MEDEKATHKFELERALDDPNGLYQKLVLDVQALQEVQNCGVEPVQDMMKPQLQTQVTTIDLKQALP